MYVARFQKHPDEKKKYTLDYSNWLDTGELVSSVTLTVTPSTGTPLVADGSAIDGTGTLVSFFASVGTDDVDYSVVVQATTDGGQIKVDTILFAVRE